jgi:hypothetical protein
MDTRGAIFIRPATSGQTLKDFAVQIFGWLGIPNFKEEWVGKADTQLFTGSAVGITVGVSENSFNQRRFYKKNLENYPFLISLAPQGTSQAADYLVQHAHVLAWRLSNEGFRCFVPKDLLTVNSDSDGMVYEANLTKG